MPPTTASRARVTRALFGGVVNWDAFHDYLYERLAMIEYRARGWIPR